MISKQADRVSKFRPHEGRMIICESYHVLQGLAASLNNFRAKLQTRPTKNCAGSQLRIPPRTTTAGYRTLLCSTESGLTDTTADNPRSSLLRIPTEHPLDLMFILVCHSWSIVLLRQELTAPADLLLRPRGH